MQLKEATVDLDGLRQLDKLVEGLRRQGNQLMQGRAEEYRAAGQRVWGIADKMDALLKNIVLPFGFGSFSPSAPARTGTETS